MNCSEIQFKHFVRLQRGFDLPKSRMSGGIVPVLGSNRVIGHHSEIKVEAPGVVTGRSGTLGLVQYSEQPFWPHNTTLWVQDFKGNNPKFVYYKLKTLHLERFNGGASVPTLNRNVLDTLLVRIPRQAEQARIASILSTYDDLIENNRRRIGLLEEAARLLYREWFVHFRFPGHDRVKVADSRPEGWEHLSASDAFEVNPRTHRIDDGSITYVPMAALSESGMTIDQTRLEMRQSITGVRFRNGDTLMARITPSLENGKTAFVQFLKDKEIACGSTEFIVLRRRRVSSYFVYLTARQPDFRENAVRSMIGSSGRQRVQPTCFDRYHIAVPPRALATLFDQSVGDLFEQIANLHVQNQKLTQARDLLLPRLMSGEIAV